jgi:hypothetical protein
VAALTLPPGNNNWVDKDGKPTQAFLQYMSQIGTPFAAPAPTRAGDIIYWNGNAWVALAGNNSGTQFLQENASGVPSWATIAAVAGSLVSVITYSSTQTITIPATATKALIRMWGGSGGSGGINAAGGTGGTGAAGYLEKYLTGLTPGNTLTYTQGALGAAGASTPTNGGNGTASTLASGTQTITTLTANGSNGSGLVNANQTVSGGTAGGTATNGDLNITGQSGQSGITGDTAGATAVFGFGGKAGDSLFAPGANGVGINTGGAATAGNAGRSGGLVIFWFT